MYKCINTIILSIVEVHSRVLTGSNSYSTTIVLTTSKARTDC